MTKNYRVHYRLFSYRQAPPPERMGVLLHELRTPVSIMRAYSQLLNECVRESDSASAQAGDFLHSLLDSVSALDEIIAAQMPKVPYLTENTLQTFRALVLPLINQMAERIDWLASLKHEIEPICSDIPAWHDIFLRHSNHIWATVDVLTNPALELPPAISYWINNRQFFWQEVHQGDSRSLEPILNGLTHSEIEIRLDAIRLLGQLKHPESFKQLITALTDEEPEGRAEAVEALKGFGDRRAIDPLRERLHDEKECVRLRAKEAIEHLQQG